MGKRNKKKYIMNLDEFYTNLSQKKLIMIEREELEREQEKFYFLQKKHETEVWAVKNEYIEQTKRLKKQYTAYKQTCDQLINIKNNKKMRITPDIIKYHKLDCREKLVKDAQKSLLEKQKTAQILYQTSTELLQKAQEATLKMACYAKLCDEKNEIERDRIKKQEMDRKKYLSKVQKLRDEMLSAPYLMSNDLNINKLHKELTKTYIAIREERRKFLPVQRKWAKLIANHQVFNHDQNEFKIQRKKLENMRMRENEFKMKMLEDIKSMNCDQKKMEIKQTEIMLEYKSELIEDKERQIRNEQKLLRLQQRNLEESLIEFEYERELISAQKTKKNDSSNINFKLKEQIKKNEELTQKLELIQNNKKDEKIMKMMEHLTEKFEQIQFSKNEELQKYKEKANKLEIELKKENKALFKKNNEINEENEHLRDQIQEMILSSNEANTQKTNIQNISSKNLLAIDDEADNLMSDQSNFEETALKLSSIRSKLESKSDIFTKHESHSSMTAIVDLVKKAKNSIISESQCIDLELLSEKEDDQSCDDQQTLSEIDKNSEDSFSDHLGLIEELIQNEKNKEKENKKEERKKKKKKK